jgi:Cu/Ag efflux pump CusA
VLATVPGAVDVAVDSPPGEPQWTLKLDPEAAARQGLKPLELLDAIQVAFQGQVVGQIFEGNRVTDVAVTLDPAARRAPEAIGAIPVQTPAGRSVPLSQLVKVLRGTGRYAVLHEGAQRRALVTCNLSGRGLSAFVADAERAIKAKAALPPGVSVHFGGVFEAQTRAHRELLLLTLVALVGIVVVLGMVFHNGRNLALVLANLPFALAGGLLAICLTGGAANLGALVGFVTLFGITTRNSIMLVSHAEHLVLKEGFTWNSATARRAAEERLVPILMTATVTSLALLPLALGARAPGREIEGPMAIVILGGLISSTLLNLLLLPTLIQRFGRFAPAEDAEAAAAQPQES